MARKTDRASVAAFYDALAPQYEEMTDFDRRFVVERPFFRLIVDRYGISSAVDAGAGTGFHSLLLAQLGVHVTAVDLSREMIRLLEKHAHEMNLRVHAMASDFESMPRRVGTPVDAVLCLGNTLVHADSRAMLERWLLSFKEVVRPGGVVMIQIMNFDRILHDRERVQSVREAGGKTFVRFYDYDDEATDFNILTIERNPKPSASIRTVRLHPLRAADLARALRDAGFSDIALHGSIALEPFDPKKSPNIVAFAFRPPASASAGGKE